MKTGVGVEVDLPYGLVNRGTLCLSESGLYATQATLESSRLVGARIVNRPATIGDADWTVVVEPALDLEQVYGGSLECLPEDEIAMLVAASPNAYLLTFSAPTGRPVHDRYNLPPDGARVIGQLDDRTVLASRTGRETLTIITHDPGETWISTGAEITSDAIPVVLGGELRQVRAALASIGPGDLDLPTINY